MEVAVRNQSDQLRSLLGGLVVGLVAGELRRRSGSVWPGVVTHLVHNAMAQVVALAFAGVL